MLLSIKIFKQKRFSKKLSRKSVQSFQIKIKINEQTYRLTLFNTSYIENIFQMLFLKLYFHRADD